MQFLLPLYYSLRSIVLRGLVNSVGLLRAEVHHEKSYGIATSSIKKSRSKEFYHYQGASYSVLLRLLRTLGERYHSYDFVDIGCGKGRVLIVAEKFGFKKLVGIELDEELVEDAKKNIALYQRKTADSTIDVYRINALEYTYGNKPTVYFLFNPFNETILDKVLTRILTSNKKEAIFIYMNPLYRKPFESRGLQLLHKVKTRWYTEALIYRREAQSLH